MKACVSVFSVVILTERCNSPPCGVFWTKKGEHLPKVSLKLVGGMSDADLAPYLSLEVPIVSRNLHLPSGNRKYAGSMPPMPEHGLCLDLLHHPSITWNGYVYLCNRLDTHQKGLIGDLERESLDQIWNGPLRQAAISAHIAGQRDSIAACADCRYYGIPAT